MIPIVAGLLMGAAMGGGIAALQGKDVLKGALMGGAGGALGGVLMPAAGAVAPVAESAAATGTAGLFNPTMAPGVMDGVTGAISSGGVGGAAGSGGIGAFLSANKGALTGGALGGMFAPGPKPPSAPLGNIREFDFNPGERNPLFGNPGESYYTGNRGFTEGAVIPVEDYNKANGGIIALAEGGDVDRYTRPTQTVNPAVAAYNAQLMERANAQYNINPRPGPNQVPGFDSKEVKHYSTATENKGFVPAEGSVYAEILAEKKRKEEAGLSGNAPYYNYGYENLGGDVGANDMGNDPGAPAGNNPSDAGNFAGEMGSNADSPMGDQGNQAGEMVADGGRIRQRYNMGGISSLGAYSDGGQLLKGPGDGVSDSIPARIGSRQPARLADGEFVVPARTVSELGNGSTDAGAKQLYKMMNRVQNARKKSIGKGKVAVDSKARRMLPA